MTNPTLADFGDHLEQCRRESPWHGGNTLFAMIPRWVAHHPDISDAAIRTWTVIAGYANEDGIAWPSVATRRLGHRRRKT